MTEARKKAVADAMAKAKTLAEAAGVEPRQDPGNLRAVLRAAADADDARKPSTRAAQAVPIEAGENAYRVQVNVTFELN